MKKMDKAESSKIIPQKFDLAIIEVVEFIHHQGEKLQKILDKVPDKKDILTDIGITHFVWPQMVNHHRFVSTKALKQKDIVSRLKQKYLVNPAYIWDYPNEKKMFLLDDVFIGVSEEDSKYNMPGSAKLLKQQLSHCRKKGEELEALINEKNKTIIELKEDNSNLKLLVSELKKQITT